MQKKSKGTGAARPTAKAMEALALENLQLRHELGLLEQRLVERMSMERVKEDIITLLKEKEVHERKLADNSLEAFIAKYRKFIEAQARNLNAGDLRALKIINAQIFN